MKLKGDTENRLVGRPTRSHSASYSLATQKLEIFHGIPHPVLLLQVFNIIEKPAAPV